MIITSKASATREKLLIASILKAANNGISVDAETIISILIDASRTKY